jgi:hypothetical protein
MRLISEDAGGGGVYSLLFSDFAMQNQKKAIALKRSCA